MNFNNHNKRKRISSPNDFPDGATLAIIQFDTYTIPGDERSRTHPGHGHSESTGTSVSYTAYLPENREAWLEDIKELMAPKYGSSKDFIALENGKRVIPTISVKVQV